MSLKKIRHQVGIFLLSGIQMLVLLVGSMLLRQTDPYASVIKNTEKPEVLTSIPNFHVKVSKMGNVNQCSRS